MRTIGLTVCALSAVLFAGACGASSDSKSNSNAARVPAGAPAQAQAGQSGGQSGAQAVPLPGPGAGRAIVYTANLQVRTGNVAEATGHAKQLVTASGGFVATESESSTPDSADITFKVPAAQYPVVLDQLGRLGKKVSLQQNAEDVTQQIADVDSRVLSAKATLASFRKLLDKANTIGEVLDVEQQITTRESDLEALQARQKALAQQTAYGTVSLNLQSSATPGAKPDHRGGGFGGGLSAGWSAFTTFLWVLMTVLGWLLPFLVLGAVIGLPAERIRRNRRKPTAPPVEPAYTAAPPPPEL